MATVAERDKLFDTTGVDPSLIDIVNGYIRNEQDKLFKIATQNAFYNVPKLINLICISYLIPLFEYDENNYERVGNTFTKRNAKYHERKIAILIGDWMNSEYYAKHCNKPIIVRFKIDVNKTGYNEFGIVQKGFVNNGIYLDNTKTAYCYSHHGEIYEKAKRDCRKKVTSFCGKDGTLVTLRLNFKDKSLKYEAKNGRATDKGYVSKNIEIGSDIEYKFAMTIGWTDETITVLSP